VTPSGAAAARDPSGGLPPPDRALMSIGEVLSHLRGDFPDATISKLRFLEAEGLVEPRRTPAGYRKYTWADVARLRYVFTAQRDHYLPLRVIREQLAALDDGDGARPALSAVSRPEVTGRADLLSRADLAARAGLTEAQLAALEQHGLVRARPDGRYDADALVVAEVAAELARFGVEPRHLRGSRAAADREVGLYAQLVTPLARQSDPAARARAAETVRELVTLSQKLHGALIRSGLRDTLGP